jgi:hypothetical protein
MTDGGGYRRERESEPDLRDIRQCSEAVCDELLVGERQDRRQTSTGHEQDVSDGILSCPLIQKVADR